MISIRKYHPKDKPAVRHILIETSRLPVETEKDIELMYEVGAFVAQGYFYSKPVPEEEFEKKLNAQA